MSRNYPSGAKKRAISLKRKKIDLYFWPEREKMSEAFRNYWIQRGATPCQNKNRDFKESVIQLEKESQRRFCAISLFTRVHARTGDYKKQIYLFKKMVYLLI